MTREEIQRFNVRISQANKGELLVITYDILIKYLEDTLVAYNEDDKELLGKNLKGAQNTVRELVQGLDYQYEIADNLMQLYRYFNKTISNAIVKRNVENIDKILELINSMRNAFYEAAKTDHSEPLMETTHQVYAGLTYGKGQLNEAVIDSKSNRGFRI